MPGNETFLKELLVKFHRLIRAHQDLQKENEKLLNQVNILRKSDLEKKAEIDLLEQKLQILRAASGQMSEQDQKDFEKRISRYIRDIDQCIELLSE